MRLLPRPRLPAPLVALAALAALLSAGCDSGGGGHALAVPVYDTLPGGIPRVMSPGPTRWEGETGWQLELVQEFRGEEGASSELVNPQSLAVDDSGNVYVVDQKPAVIKVYDQDGRFIRTIGGEGQGPGEFRAGYIALHEGQTILHDPQVARTSVWDTAGAFVASWASTGFNYADIHVDREGRISVPALLQGPSAEQSRGAPWIRWSIQGALIDTVWIPARLSEAPPWTVVTRVGGREVGQMTVTVPLRAQTITGFHPAGGFLMGWSDEYQVAISPNGRDTTSVFGRTWQAVPISSERREAVVEDMVQRFSRSMSMDEALLRRSFTPDAIPATAPAFTSLHVDQDGYRWVRLDPGMDSTVTRFDLFDPDGVLLGAVAVRPALLQYASVVFGKGELLVRATSAEGYPVIRRYQVRRDVAGER